MIIRRVFIGSLAGSLISARLYVQAESERKPVRLGRLSLAQAHARPGHASTDGIVDGLRELGYAEGRDFILERRDADGIADRLPALALELVRLPGESWSLP